MRRAGQYQIELVLFTVKTVVEDITIHFHLLQLLDGTKKQISERIEPIDNGQTLQEKQLMEMAVPDVVFLMSQHEVLLSVFHIVRQKYIIAIRERSCARTPINTDAPPVTLKHGFPPDIIQLTDLYHHIKEQQNDACSIDYKQMGLHIVPCGSKHTRYLFGRTETIF